MIVKGFLFSKGTWCQPLHATATSEPDTARRMTHAFNAIGIGPSFPIASRQTEVIPALWVLGQMRLLALQFSLLNARKSPDIWIAGAWPDKQGVAMSHSIEYFYSAHSAFAYLGSARLMAIAEATDCRIVHRPMDLRRVVREGGAQPIAQRSQAHIDYFFGREIDRWSQERDAPVIGHMPTHHRKDITLPNCVIIAGILAGVDVDHLAHALLTGHWRDDADLADPATLSELVTKAGYDAEFLLNSAQYDRAVSAAYEANTDEAVARSVFGSPTYFVDGDMFYGQDRLELIEKTLWRKIE